LETIRLELELKGNLFEEDGFWIAELPQLDLCEIGKTQKDALYSLCNKAKNFIPAALSVAVGKDSGFSMFCVWRKEVLDAIMHRASIIQKALESYRNSHEEAL